jgi:hypothetical protein
MHGTTIYTNYLHERLRARVNECNGDLSSIDSRLVVFTGGQSRRIVMIRSDILYKLLAVLDH